jgi:hypothetical protein
MPEIEISIEGTKPVVSNSEQIPSLKFTRNPEEGEFYLRFNPRLEKHIAGAKRC